MPYIFSKTDGSMTVTHIIGNGDIKDKPFFLERHKRIRVNVIKNITIYKPYLS